MSESPSGGNRVNNTLAAEFIISDSIMRPDDAIDSSGPIIIKMNSKQEIAGNDIFPVFLLHFCRFTFSFFPVVYWSSRSLLIASVDKELWTFDLIFLTLLHYEQ